MKSILWLFFTGIAFAQPPVQRMVQIANASSTGTTVHKLAKLTGAPSKAVVSGAGDTGGVIGIVNSGAGTTGSATIQESGQTTCVFDGATTAGHYVQISASVAGDCTDAGATLPTSGQVIGQVLTTNGGGGTYTVDMANRGGGGSSPTITCSTDVTCSPNPLSGVSTLGPVVGLNGTLLSGLATGLLFNTTSTGVPSIIPLGTGVATALGQNVSGSGAICLVSSSACSFPTSAFFPNSVLIGTPNTVAATPAFVESPAAGVCNATTCSKSFATPPAQGS